MTVRPYALVLGAGLFSALAAAQTGSAMLDGTKTPHPGSPETIALSPEGRGDIYMVRKMYREAIEAYSLGSPKDPVLKNKIGIAYHQWGHYESARLSYQEALKLNPHYMEAMNNLGAIYYAKRNFRHAITWYEKALKVKNQDASGFASVYMNLGTAWFARKSYTKADRNYQIALKLDPNVFEHHGSFGQILEERTVEERARFHFYLAKTYAKQGRNDLAIQNLRKSLEEGYGKDNKDSKKKWSDEPDLAGLRNLPEFQQLLALEPRVL